MRHPRAKAIAGLAIAAAVLIGVPLIAVSHQSSQRADNRARFSAYQQWTIDQGLTTREQWDEIARKDAAIREESAQRRAVACQGRPLGCWIEDNEPLAAYVLVVGVIFLVLIARVASPERAGTT